ncbi:MAG: MFS transporter [Desulfobacterales bacterium]|nr:MFS transporter [Desulfobacterales bacterium]
MFFHRLCPAVIALDIQSSFGISGTLLGLLGSAYFYSYAAMQLPTGLMADSWGPRKTVSVFFVLAGIGSVMMGAASDLSLAIVGRVLVGLGVSTVFVCNFKLLSEWFNTRQFVIMGGVFMAMGGIGALFSSAPLAWVSNLIGWRMTLVSVGIVSLFMSVLTYTFVRDRPSEMGLPSIRPDHEDSETGIGLLTGMRIVVTSGRFWPISIWAFCVIGIAFAIGGLWGGPYLMQAYGLSKAASGGVLSTFALALIVGGPSLGWLANRFGRKPVLIGCSLVLMVVCGLMCWYVNTMALPTLYLMFFLLFLTGGAAGPVVAAVSKELFPIAISGTSIGAVNLFPFLGGAFYQVVIGAVLTAGSRGQEGYDVVGFQYMFLICLAGAALSLAAALLLKETLSESARS